MARARAFAGFDRVAVAYRWLEYAALGKALERIRFVHLTQLAEAQRVLILGEGDGRFLSQLLRVNNTAQIVVVDKSPNMLRLARARVNGSARVEFLEQDVAAYVSASSALEPAFDSIVALFFLDCLSEAELSQLIPQLSGKLAPNGVWYVSDFHLPRSRLPRLLARVWLRFLYLFFGYFTDILARELVIPDPYLAGAGCFKTREILQVAGLLRATEFRKVTPEQVSRGAAG